MELHDESDDSLGLGETPMLGWLRDGPVTFLISQKENRFVSSG